MKDYGDLDTSCYNLLQNICKELNINFRDFYNGIYDY